MTGQTSNERGAESSGFVTTTSLIIERRRIVRGADVNYKDKVIRTAKERGTSRNSLFFNAFTHICYLSPTAGLVSKRRF